MKWGRGGYLTKKRSKQLTRGALLLFLFGVISFWLIWTNLDVSNNHIVSVQNDSEKKESIIKPSSKDYSALKTEVEKDGFSQSDSFVPITNLDVVKTAVLNDEIIPDGNAQAGETIIYTYTLTNTGNVALDKIGIQDIFHNDMRLLDERVLSGNSELTKDKQLDGVWDTLGAGDSIELIYEVTVKE